jgi:2-succinyl-6-hydroxy-2,4-cyclohexadiene-1-carboxylate synthase
MRLRLNDGIELHYTLTGEAAAIGRTVVLLHGFTGCSESWQSISKGLSDSWRVILPDLLGHGQSSAPDNPALYRMEAAAESLALLINQSADEPVHLAGYSMGGRLALYFALFYPELVRSVVLESASPGLATEAERTARCAADNALADAILFEGIESFVARWEALPLFASQLSLSQDLLQQQRRIRLANRPTGLAGSLRGLGTGVQPSLWDRIGRLTCPVLLIVGEWDTKFLEINRRMIQSIPNASLTIIPQAGHTTHLEQPALFTQRIREFWDSLAPGMAQLHP